MPKPTARETTDTVRWPPTSTARLVRQPRAAGRRRRCGRHGGARRQAPDRRRQHPAGPRRRRAAVRHRHRARASTPWPPATGLYVPDLAADRAVGRPTDPARPRSAPPPACRCRSRTRSSPVGVFKVYASRDRRPERRPSATLGYDHRCCSSRPGSGSLTSWRPRPRSSTTGRPPWTSAGQIDVAVGVVMERASVRCGGGLRSGSAANPTTPTSSSATPRERLVESLRRGIGSARRPRFERRTPRRSG